MTTSTNPAETVTRLESERAINRLLSVYCHNLDDGKFAENSELLQHATMEVIGVKATGRDAIEQFFINGVQRHGDGTTRTWHTVSNVLIDIDASGDKATSASYFTVHQELESFPLQPIAMGRYVDSFERHNGEWRFVYRLIKPRLFGDLRFHAAAPVDKSQL